MKRWIVLITGFIALILFGLGLWFRQGADVWINAVIAFCT